MTITYLTGTRHPGKALLSFLPDFIEMLAHRGDTLLTTNKMGVDEVVIRHCEQQELPLQVCEFVQHGGKYKNRHVERNAEHVQVQRIITPSWMRFRHLVDRAEKMIFLHSAKSKGRRYGMSTAEAFEKACQKRGIEGEQLIVQNQYDRYVNVTELRSAQAVGTAHVYVYARRVKGIDNTRYHIAHYRIESWRSIGEIIQPGIGRREIVVPTNSTQKATLHALHQALLELKNVVPYGLVIHHEQRDFSKAPYRKHMRGYREIRLQVRDLLAEYSLVTWEQEEHATLLQRIGSHIKDQSELWYHDKAIASYRGVYG